MRSGLFRNFRLALAVSCLAFTTITSNVTSAESWRDWQLVVSADGRRIDKANGAEWFYLADTAWSLPVMLNREEIDLYLRNRRDKGFSVIQTVAVMGYNTEWNAPNAYGHRPFIGGDPTKPDTRETENYWTHLDWTINQAREYGLYVMLTPIWGSSFISGETGVGKKVLTTPELCRSYGSFIANRYKDTPNIIWMNGGDTSPKDEERVLFNTLGTTIKEICTKQLMGYHGHGFLTKRHSEFIEQEWNDFANCYSHHFTQDISDLNYKLVLKNWEHKPAKPIFDTEPAYEGIPKDIAFPKTGYFEARDARRRAYWSVMAGAAGHAFGNNDVHLFAKKPFQGMRYLWKKGMDEPAAAQMGYLNKLMLSRSRKGLVADAGLVVSIDPVGKDGQPEKKLNIEIMSALYGAKGDAAKQVDIKTHIQKKLEAHEYDFQITNAFVGSDPAEGAVKVLMLKYKQDGKEVTRSVEEFGYPFRQDPVPAKYRHIQACRTDTTAWYYIYTGAAFTAQLGRIKGDVVKARWFNPREGTYEEIGTFPNQETKHFDPPGYEAEGNDWVLEISSL